MLHGWRQGGREERNEKTAEEKICGMARGRGVKRRDNWRSGGERNG